LTTTWQLLQVRSVRVYRPWASVVVWTPPRRGSPTLTTAPASGARPPAGSPPGPNGTTWVTVPRRARWAEGGGFVPARSAAVTTSASPVRVGTRIVTSATASAFSPPFS